MPPLGCTVHAKWCTAQTGGVRKRVFHFFTPICAGKWGGAYQNVTQVQDRAKNIKKYLNVTHVTLSKVTHLYKTRIKPYLKIHLPLSIDTRTYSETNNYS